MADEAFALSPISARAALPSDADYDAIRDAFMETSRGRWFLGEYAKRNRNADTSMVLDAVARIEEALAAQRQPPPVDDRLPGALQAIRSAVDRAADAASAALAGLSFEDNLAPVRKGARIIKEISWRWREIGADSRICDLLDSQVSAIEASCGQIAEIDTRPDLNAAFDLIREKIDGFGEDGSATVRLAAEDAAVPTSAATAEPAAAFTADAAPESEVSVAAEPAMPTTAIAPEASEPEAIAPQEIEPDMPVEAAVSTIEVADEAVDAAEADDEAILDMVALEMAAPDETEEVDYFSAINDDADVLDPVTADTGAAGMPEQADADELAEAAEAAAAQPSFQPPPPRVAQPAVQPSLGSTLLASGFLDQHRPPVSDPLGPIRRMSQAERIAFFS